MFGGFVPFIATSLTVWAAAQPEGTFPKSYSRFMGLIYPVAIAFICFIIGSIYMKDVRNVKLMDRSFYLTMPFFHENAPHPDC